MSSTEFRAAGLHKLTPQEMDRLNTWLLGYSQRLVQLAKSNQARPKVSTTPTEYTVDVSHNDELFIINGEKFEARTYCFNVNKGDRVMFIEGNALGACASAEFLDLDTDVRCEVWCE